MTEGELPALDDAFAQSIGYDDAAAFEAALAANMKTEKEMQAVQKRRGAILEEALQAIEDLVSGHIKEYELDDIEARFAEDIGRAGATMERTSPIPKRREELRETWEEGADLRVKVRLSLPRSPVRERSMYPLTWSTTSFPTRSNTTPKSIQKHCEPMSSMHCATNRRFVS